MPASAPVFFTRSEIVARPLVASSLYILIWPNSAWG